MIAGVLLAAGRSSRFGSDKLCALLDGQPVIVRSLRTVAALDDVVVVIPPDAAALVAVLPGTKARIVANPDRDSGMSSSLRVAIESVSDADAVVVALGDQPYASAEVTRMLLARWREGGADIVVPEYTDGRGHPVLFGRVCFEALRMLEGDSGARGLIGDARFRVARVQVSTPMPIDVDTPEALALAARRASDDASISPPYG